MTTVLNPCPAPDCSAQVPSERFACRRHWYALPQQIRNRIWATWKARLAARRHPTRQQHVDAHEAAKASAVAWLRDHEPRPPRQLPLGVPA